MSNTKYTIYRINTVEGFYYVGKAKHFNARKIQHKTVKYSCNKWVRKCIKTHGRESVWFETLVTECPRKWVGYFESKYAFEKPQYSLNINEIRSYESIRFADSFLPYFTSIKGTFVQVVYPNRTKVRFDSDKIYKQTFKKI